MDLTAARIAALVHADLLGSPDARVTRAVTDHRQLPPEGGLFAALPGARVDGHDFLAAAAPRAAVLLVRRDRSSRLAPPAPGRAVLLVEDPGRALRELAAAQRSRFRGTVLGITGSCGKTTTRCFLAAALESALGPGTAAAGNQNNALGVPLTLLRGSDADAWLLTELGTNARGEIEDLCSLVRPEHGIITGVMRAHLQGLGSLEGVLDEKAALGRALPASGTAVLPGDDPRLMAEGRTWAAERHTFGPGEDCDVRIVDVQEGLQVTGTLRIRGRLMKLTLPVPGTFNLRNAAAALTLTTSLGLDPDRCAAAIEHARLEPLRMETRELASATFLLDCYNANPDSMLAALDTLGSMSGERTAVVLGPMEELGTASARLHAEVVRRACRVGVDLFLALERPGGAYGSAGTERLRAFRRVADAPTAAKELASWLRPGDVVLLKGSRQAKVEQVWSELVDR
jgi:UDP-N-acetylmuramoyl-tripeptide--D-alanyl-D-alanine ligase